jgi:hypothetical protein
MINKGRYKIEMNNPHRIWVQITVRRLTDITDDKNEE